MLAHRWRRRAHAGWALAPLLLVIAVLAACPAAVTAGAVPPVPAPQRIVFHGDRSRPVVALTFDDGWGIENCRRIFQILRRERVMATFFPAASHVKRAPDLWRAIARAGYPIANHTKNHPILTRLPAWRVRAELTTAQAIIEGITGVPMVRVFRPPGGAHNAMVRREAAAVGYGSLIMWDTTSADTSSSRSVWSVQQRALNGRNGSIVLLHCGPDETPAALPGIIRGYRARGFRFVTIPELLGPKVAPWPTAAPKPSAPPSPTPSPAPTSSPDPGPTGSPGASPSSTSPPATPPPVPTPPVPTPPLPPWETPAPT